MAASRHGGYRNGEFHLEEARIRRMVYPLGSRYQYQHANPCRRDLRREPNERGFSNRSHHDYPQRNHSSPVTGKRALDLEPGELSSHHGSDSRRSDELKSRRENVGTRNQMSPGQEMTKKRRLSPVVWDGDERRHPDVGSNRISKTAEEISVDGIPVCLPSQTEPISNLEYEPGQIEEDEDSFFVARTIASSRWADDDDDRDIVAPKRKKSISSLERNSVKNVMTPEQGEVITDDGSDRASSRSSCSATCDYMVVDGERRTNHSDHSSQGGYESEEIPEPAGPPRKRINMLQGSRSVDEFERLNKINEGTYGVVYRARDKKTREVVALKKIKMENVRDGFPMTSLREINILASLNHPSIVDVKEVVVGSELDSIFMVMEYMEHDLKGVMETMKQPYSQSEAKCLMLQLLEGINYLHDNWILHR